MPSNWENIYINISYSSIEFDWNHTSIRLSINFHSPRRSSYSNLMHLDMFSIRWFSCTFQWKHVFIWIPHFHPIFMHIILFTDMHSEIYGNWASVIFSFFIFSFLFENLSTTLSWICSHLSVYSVCEFLSRFQKRLWILFMFGLYRENGFLSYSVYHNLQTLILTL